MREHVLPFRLQLRAVRRVLDQFHRRHGQAFRPAFFHQDFTNQLGLITEIAATEKIDDVIKIAGAARSPIARIFSAKTSSNE